MKKTFASMKSPSARKDALTGLLFIAPWLLGTIFFFLRQFVLVFVYAFSKEDFMSTGKHEFVGLFNYSKVFRSDVTFIRSFFESISGILLTSIFVILFSIFVALILNSEFRGRTLVRAIFFLPVIIATGPIIEIISGDDIARLLMSGQQTSTLYGTNTVQDLLLAMGLSDNIANIFGQMMGNIFNLSWKSGIQILLFMAALQNVPNHLYEAAKVEGASGWEMFWRVTFPIITPILLLNTIYTLIDGFTDYTNVTVKLIVDYTQNLHLSYAAALGTIYFLVVFVLVGVVYIIINRRTFYMEK